LILIGPSEKYKWTNIARVLYKSIGNLRASLILFALGETNRVELS